MLLGFMATPEQDEKKARRSGREEVEVGGKRTNKTRVGELAWDAAKDTAVGETVDWLAKKAGLPIELPTPPTKMGKLFSKAASSPAQTAVEIAKGTHLIMSEGARDGHAEAGEALMREPLWFQGANMFLSTSDAMSKYGAAKEARDLKEMQKLHLGEDVLAGVQDDNLRRGMELDRRGELTEAQSKDVREGIDPEGKRTWSYYGGPHEVPEVDPEKERNLAEARRALEYQDLEQGTMGLVRNYLAQHAPR